ncbi:MAG: hypothetical protein IPK59_17205 [Rhodospirillaceae bacterium]|nr:hypothetical protein [Rhodospirillaceae bacterium]
MRKNPWFRASFDLFSLGMEAATVMSLRTAKIALGGAAADTESQRMVQEKIDSALDLQTMFMTGQMGASGPAAVAKTLAHYRRKVRANRRRLSKS